MSILLKQKLEIINDKFNDNRELELINNNDYSFDLFRANDDELIVLDLHIGVFDAEVLTSKVNIAEKLYNEYGVRVNLYIVSDGGMVTVKECSVKSEAEFIIKLAVFNEDFCKFLLNNLKDKFRCNGFLDDEDVKLLSVLPLLCGVDERDFYRTEYFLLVSQAYD